MNKILFPILIAGALILGSCKTTVEDNPETRDSSGGVAEITFAEYEHNFGKIVEGEKVAYMFKFENSGDSDLIISSVTTSCGCTVPKFEKQPIKPGESGSIEVQFDSAHREGTQTKTVTVRSNASVKIIVLRIVAEIITNNK